MSSTATRLLHTSVSMDHGQHTTTITSSLPQLEMSFNKRETDDSETQDVVTRSGQHVRLRFYRKEDSQKVRDLFTYCMGNGPGAPRETAIAEQLRQPFAYAAYSIFTVGLGLAICPSLPKIIYSAAHKIFSLFPSPIQTFVSKSGISCTLNYLRPSRLYRSLQLRPRTWSTIMSAVSAGSLLSYLAFINYSFYSYCKDSLNGDLKDIAGYYQDSDALNKGGQFWVVEDVEKDKIIACVGLDTTGSVPELRRMCVHSSYRRLGLGHLLINALLAHTIKHNVRCIPELRIPEVILGTSSYQPGAVRMYEQHGWAMQRKERLSMYVSGFFLLTMRRKMDVGA